PRAPKRRLPPPPPRPKERRDMSAARRVFVVFAATATLAALAGCGASVEEMIMNPTTKDEIVQKLMSDEVAKHDLQTGLTAEDQPKKEHDEDLPGDRSIQERA